MNKGIDLGRETELLERIRAKDETAFKTLYEMTAGSVYAYIYRILKDKTMAEDVQIEVFTQVWKGIGSFQGRSQVKTWIFGIARNLALNELRKCKKHMDIDELPLQAEDNQHQIENAEQGKIIQQAMAKISAKHREVLDLVFFHEMHYEEIAKLLEISVNTVKTRVFYAKEALKQKMTLMGVSHG